MYGLGAWHFTSRARWCCPFYYSTKVRDSCGIVGKFGVVVENSNRFIEFEVFHDDFRGSKTGSGEGDGT
jgi:hypothetical protein